VVQGRATLWTPGKYSKKQLDRAGETLRHVSRFYESDDYRGLDDISDAEIDESFQALNYYRAAHSYPLNSLTVGLKTRVRNMGKEPIIAQRLKRVPSILQKLRRFDKMKLSRMQDLGGCRAVMETLEDVNSLIASYKKNRHNHSFAGEKDYIDKPKPSGYRCYHLVYSYRGKSDAAKNYDGLQIEVQIRTRLQHAWATAVETMDTFLQTSLKSSEGPERWLRFFQLIGSAFAMMENTPLVPETPGSRSETLREIKQIARELDVKSKFVAYGSVMEDVSRGTTAGIGHYYLMRLRPATSSSQATLEVQEFPSRQLEMANEQYAKAEQELAKIAGAQVVLVSVESLDSLRRAYPNYFLDTRLFLEEIDRLIR